MTEYHSPEDEAVRLSDDAAHRLLARAIELDQTRSSDTTVRELRDAAREAGISVQAFDAALRELAAAPRAVDTAGLRPPPGGILRRLWGRLQGKAREKQTVGDAAVSNVMAAVVSWALLFLLARITAGIGWWGTEVAILLGCVLGVGIARRLHARVLELGLLGMIAFQVAELAMHVAFGIRAVQSGPTHFAVMIAGVLGVVLARIVDSTTSSDDSRARELDVLAALEATDPTAARNEPNAFGRLVSWRMPASLA